MTVFFGELLLAIKSYLYGIGWLVICLAVTVIGYRVFDHVCPLDLKRELENKNLAVATLLGLYLLGLIFGTLYLAAHIS